MTALVVENDAGIRKLLEVILSREGFSVHVAADGREALRLLRSTDYSVVLLDLMMPEVSGEDVLADLAAYKPAQLRRVIVISGAAEPRMRELARAYPGVSLVGKPFEVHQLAAAVRAVHGKTSTPNGGAGSSPPAA